MGTPGKIAFPVILALGAITGYLTYTFFAAATPKQDVINSPYYHPLSTASGANGTSNTAGGGGNATNATTTSAGGNATNATTTTTSAGGNATSASAGGTSVSIVSGASTLTNTAFKPNPIAAHVGDTVTWTNDDTQPHTVTSGSNGTPDNKFNSSPNFNPLLSPGQTFQHKFTAAGQYPYFCQLHPNMVGTVSVS